MESGVHVAALIGAPGRSVFLLGTGTTAMVLFAVVLAGIGLLTTVRAIVSMDSFVRAVGLEPTPWHGSYAHQQCVDKQADKLRAVGGWQSGRSTDRRPAAGAWRRRIKRK